tara:strand:- start:128 stop:505 length:378 start_codon:yes stop_codon:yes gene_type:complete
MQTIASNVTVLDKGGETKEYVAPTILLHDFGLFVKNDSGLTLYNWDQVKEISWADSTTINQVWGLAVAQLATDLDLDDDEYLWDDEDEDPYGLSDEEETPKKETKSEETKDSEESTEKKDDNPYE